MENHTRQELFFPYLPPLLSTYLFSSSQSTSGKATQKKKKREKKKDVREEEHVIDVKICTEKHASENHTNYTQGFRAVFFC